MQSYTVSDTFRSARNLTFATITLFSTIKFSPRSRLVFRGSSLYFRLGLFTDILQSPKAAFGVDR